MRAQDATQEPVKLFVLKQNAFPFSKQEKRCARNLTMDRIFGFICWIIGFFITICIAIFVVMNRAFVDVYWNPLVIDQFISLPLYVLILGCLAFGFLIGALIVWFNMGGLRQERRRQKKEIRNLEIKMKHMQDEQDSKSADIVPSYSVLQIK
ncbi:MAG: DUF1049 domain-containing protein [Alphaproteobacteria bacterium]|nr:DUF1049 domain-containing protein [Alphaproteobacteria bacterium]